MAKKKTKAEFDAEAPEEQSADVTDAQETVAEAAKKVAECKAATAEAEAELADAQAELKLLTQGPPPVFGKHILIEGPNGDHSKRDAPEGWEQDRPYRLLMNGGTYDHVGEDASGVWIYRRH